MIFPTLLVAALATVLVVSPQGPYTSITQALAAAAPGAVIQVQPGVYHEHLEVTKAVIIQGQPGAVLDGDGQGVIVHLAAGGATLEGFTVRDSGSLLDDEDAAIVVTAPDVTVRNNQLTDVLFGIRVENAAHPAIIGNTIIGKPLDVPRRGDAMKIWYADGALLENNTIQGTRDLVLWYTPNAVVRNNRIENGRYGLHLMYDDNFVAEGNLLQKNSVAAYLMYSQHIALRHNVMADSGGVSGFGLGLKDVDQAVLEDNLFVGNRVGAFIDDSPRGGVEEAANRFERNSFIGNATGLLFEPAVRFNTLVNNSFESNDEQVGIDGGGMLQDITWAENGRGNYWSDYRGFDAGKDGVGDLPYRSERAVERLTDAHPALRFFLSTPLAQALDVGARAFPVFQPQPKLTDPAPLMEPVRPQGLPSPEALAPSAGWPGGAAALSLPALLLALLRFRPAGLKFPGRSTPLEEDTVAGMQDGNGNAPQPVIAVRGLTKRFGQRVAVDNVSFAVAPGEALALWGHNGAGKSTILRCLLGLLHSEGTITAGGFNIAKQGREARRILGYMPQEQPMLDGTLRQNLEFLAQLKAAGAERVSTVLEQMRLTDSADRPVRTLSGGMRQRALLAAALLADPAVLLLDEPTSNLDPAAREELLELLGTLKARGTAIIFASHRLDEVEALADSVLPLVAGRAVPEIPAAVWAAQPEETAYAVRR